jgi:hypothetical protein
MMPVANTQMFITSGKLAATIPEANINESPVIKGMKAPISNPVPAKTRDQTTKTNRAGPIWSYQETMSLAITH